MSINNREAIKNAITNEDVTIVAQKYTNEKSTRVLEYKIDEYSKEKLGFSTAHKLLNIKFKRSNTSEAESANFFMKCVPYDVQIQVEYLIGTGVFFKESNFFQQIIPKLSENSKCEQWYPEYYLAKEDAIIFEDLKTRGYRMIDVVDNVAALKSVLASVARLHASSMLMEDRLNCDPQKQMTLYDCYSDTLKESFFVSTGVVAEALSSFFDVSCAVAKSFGYDPVKFRKIAYLMHDMLKQSDTHRNVICHGDLWWNNMMFAEDYKCILIDFQQVRYAPLVTDLLQLFHVNASPEFRKIHEKELLEHYHSALDATIKDNDTDGSVKAPTMDEILAAVDDLRVVGLVTACFYLPIIMTDPKMTAEYGRDPKAYTSFLLDDKVGSFLAYMKVNERCKSRIEQAVVELAEHIDSFYH